MIRIDVLREEVFKFAQPICVELGLELVELTVRAYNENIYIELLADLPTGGIGIEECTRLNHRLDKDLYEVMKLGDHYTLEVSSPGLDRPIKTVQDFRRSIGRHVHLYLKERVAEKLEMDGVVKGVRDAEILVESKFGELIIGIEKIDKAKQIIS
ncbi:MAG: hypothetical protein HQL22_01885 [Candidatus Omnitrophica bacterium]|nr:hypothetical protein [Candidatus Omnitrophota bacterium]